ncbi:MAG: HAMP domain-containing sensor histidine kinase [Bacteroidota bacterium]|nr:HAMP domain-containing sensor histidine kinase [Bacteroidota bacterium]
MIKFLGNSLQRFLKMGMDKDPTFVDGQKTYMFNLFSMIGWPFALLSLIFNLYWQAYIPASFNVTQIVIFTFAFYISYSGKWRDLRALLLVVVAAIAVANGYFYKAGSEYRLMVMMLAALIFFDTHWKYFLFSSLLCIGFVWLRMQHLPVQEMDKLEKIATGLKILVPLCLFIMSLYYFKHLYFKNLSQLEISNTELSIAKEQKEKILNTVAHDLRSPINNISAISQVMLADEKLSADQKELMTLIQHSARSSLVLINDLLKKTDALNDNMQLQRTDLNALVTQTVALLELSAAKKNIRIHSDNAPQELPVNMDANKMERVITNLVNNAIKFSPVDSVIQVKVSKEGKVALLVVADQGIGIAKADQGKIFDMFTHARRKGTEGEVSYGIGLSICKKIVEQHGGTITLESEVNKGTSFFVRLPLA